MKVYYTGKEVHEIVRKYAESDVIGDVKAHRSKDKVVDGAFLGIEVDFEPEVVEEERKPFPGPCGAPIDGDRVCGVSNCQTHV